MKNGKACLWIVGAVGLSSLSFFGNEPATSTATTTPRSEADYHAALRAAEARLTADAYPTFTRSGRMDTQQQRYFVLAPLAGEPTPDVAATDGVRGESKNI